MNIFVYFVLDLYVCMYVARLGQVPANTCCISYPLLRPKSPRSIVS